MFRPLYDIPPLPENPTAEQIAKHDQLFAINGDIIDSDIAASKTALALTALGLVGMAAWEATNGLWMVAAFPFLAAAIFAWAVLQIEKSGG